MKEHCENCAAMAQQRDEAIRVRDLARDASNRDLGAKRRFEDDANQHYCEARLLSQECVRLRGEHSKLADFIESLDCDVPEEVEMAMDAVFPQHGHQRSRNPENRVAEWVRTRIGEHSMAPAERAMRLFEEAAELAQSEGLTRDMLVRQIGHIYGDEKSRPRPVGDPLQEAGGVAVCLAGYCAARETTVQAVLLSELERIEKKPIEQIRGSLARKSEAALFVTTAQRKHQPFEYDPEEGGRCS